MIRDRDNFPQVMYHTEPIGKGVPLRSRPQERHSKKERTGTWKLRGHPSALSWIGKKREKKHLCLHSLRFSVYFQVQRFAIDFDER